jgi:nuclear transport factor 2 (NTF2) superfamily protein
VNKETKEKVIKRPSTKCAIALQAAAQSAAPEDEMFAKLSRKEEKQTCGLQGRPGNKFVNMSGKWKDKKYDLSQPFWGDECETITVTNGYGNSFGEAVYCRTEGDETWRFSELQ